MRNDPYSATADFGEHDADSGPPRTSGLAVASLVCSLICCIPGLSSIGALLGVFSLINITKSGGRLGGKGLALSGIIIGVLFSVLWVLLAIFYQTASAQYTSFGQVITHIDNNEFDQARGLLSQSTKPFATDEALIDFRHRYQAESGPHTKWPTSLIDGIVKIFPLMSNQQGSQPSMPYKNTMPVPGEFANGDHLVWFVLNSPELDASGARPAILNFAIQRADGDLIWLVDPDVLRAGPPPITPGTDTPAEEAPPAAPAPGEGG